MFGRLRPNIIIIMLVNTLSVYGLQWTHSIVLMLNIIPYLAEMFIFHSFESAIANAISSFKSRKIHILMILKIYIS